MSVVVHFVPLPFSFCDICHSNIWLEECLSVLLKHVLHGCGLRDAVHLGAVLSKVQVILLKLGMSAEDYSPTLGIITINRLVLFPACLSIFKCDFVCNKCSLALLCTIIYSYFRTRGNTMQLPWDSAYTCTDPHCQVLVLQHYCWFQTDFFSLVRYIPAGLS